MKKLYLIAVVVVLLVLFLVPVAEAGGNTWYKCSRITGCKYRVNWTGAVRWTYPGSRISLTSATPLGGGWTLLGTY